MTRTIQKHESTTTDVIRRAFLEHAADLYGLALDDTELDRLAALDDRAAISGAFPQLSDVEVGEALWALGRFA